jgi:predicted nucleic acid-binding protein
MFMASTFSILTRRPTQFEDLRRQKIRSGSQDLRIAAVALVVRGILVTCNQRILMP